MRPTPERGGEADGYGCKGDSQEGRVLVEYENGKGRCCGMCGVGDEGKVKVPSVRSKNTRSVDPLRPVPICCCETLVTWIELSTLDRLEERIGVGPVNGGPIRSDVSCK